MFQWNDHKNLEGMHAFLGGSKYQWLNWDDETFEQRFFSQYSTQIGTAIHELAHDCIVSGTRLGKFDLHLIDITLFHANIPNQAYDSKAILYNLLPFVNDAIGYRMSSEVVLYYNYYCFGTADAITFNEKHNILRIHDLKTGTSQAHMEQLLIYAALFCLEYHKNPEKFNTELRIYQNAEIATYIPEPGEIKSIMDLIVNRGDYISELLRKEPSRVNEK